MTYEESLILICVSHLSGPLAPRILSPGGATSDSEASVVDLASGVENKTGGPS